MGKRTMGRALAEMLPSPKSPRTIASVVDRVVKNLYILLKKVRPTRSGGGQPESLGFIYCVSVHDATRLQSSRACASLIHGSNNPWNSLTRDLLGRKTSEASFS